MVSASGRGGGLSASVGRVGRARGVGLAVAVGEGAGAVRSSATGVGDVEETTVDVGTGNVTSVQPVSSNSARQRIPMWARRPRVLMLIFYLPSTRKRVYRAPERRRFRFGSTEERLANRRERQERKVKTKTTISLRYKS
jgi:hypothetical protein